MHVLESFIFSISSYETVSTYETYVTKSVSQFLTQHFNIHFQQKIVRIVLVQDLTDIVVFKMFLPQENTWPFPKSDQTSFDCCKYTYRNNKKI